MYTESRKVNQKPEDMDLAFCYEALNSVSRSFALVIQQLPQPLRDTVCVLYLVLRGLDTVEDSMDVPPEDKLPLLLTFHERISDPGLSLDFGPDNYRRLLNEFGTVSKVYLRMQEDFRVVISDVCRRMGEGMAEFLQKEVVTQKDFDIYCHYVHGVVWMGVSNLFAESGLESKELILLESLANELGMFLQKTNMTRDYLEDILEGRTFWPKDVWKLYGNELGDFMDLRNRTEAIKCLNHMITSALKHVPACFEYLSKLTDPMIFRFCAIPQVLAIGTLGLMYNNGEVFEGVVKMRRGETSFVFDRLRSHKELYEFFHHHAEIIKAKCLAIPSGADPNVEDTLQTVENIKQLCEEKINP